MVHFQLNIFLMESNTKISAGMIVKWQRYSFEDTLLLITFNQSDGQALHSQWINFRLWYHTKAKAHQIAYWSIFVFHEIDGWQLRVYLKTWPTTAHIAQLWLNFSRNSHFQRGQPTHRPFPSSRGSITVCRTQMITLKQIEVLHVYCMYFLFP